MRITMMSFHLRYGSCHCHLVGGLPHIYNARQEKGLDNLLYTLYGVGMYKLVLYNANAIHNSDKRMPAVTCRVDTEWTRTKSMLQDVWCKNRPHHLMAFQPFKTASVTVCCGNSIRTVWDWCWKYLLNLTTISNCLREHFEQGETTCVLMTYDASVKVMNK